MTNRNEVGNFASSVAIVTIIAFAYGWHLMPTTLVTDGTPDAIFYFGNIKGEEKHFESWKKDQTLLS